MKKKRIFAALAAVLLLTACSLPILSKEREEIPMTYSNLSDTAGQDVVTDHMGSAGIAKADYRTVLGWANDFNRLTEGMYPFPEGFAPADGEIVPFESAESLWQTQRDYPDVSPRIAAYALLSKGIAVRRTLEESEWSSRPQLLADRKAMNENPVVHWNEVAKSSLLTLFAPVTAPPGAAAQQQAEAISAAWEERQVSIAQTRASLITLWTVQADGSLFAEGAGALVEAEDDLLYMEKIAAYSPYQALLFGTEAQLADYLTRQAEAQYAAKGMDAPAVVVLKNNVPLG